MLLFTAFATVHQLYSSTTTSGRTHGCMGELLTFECHTSGESVSWTVAIGTKMPLTYRFISTDPVNTIISHTDITAILLETYDGFNPGQKNFTSVIFIKLTNTTLFSNITCSSNAANAQTLNYSIAGKYLINLGGGLLLYHP